MRGRRGFSLVELIIALTLGVIVLGAAMGYLFREMRTLAGSEIRQSLGRNGRYIGVSLRHDIQKAGIEIESANDFGTVKTWPGDYGDTLVILYVPYQPSPAPLHPLVPPPGSDDPLTGNGTCGSRCLDLLKGPLATLELGGRDLARLQVGTARRLILIEDLVDAADSTFQVTFTDADLILRQTAGLSGGLQLTRSGTFVQKLTPIVYYVDAEQQLHRAVRMNLNGSPDGHILAYGVERFDVKLVFFDGDELDQANPTDSDDSNDYDDIVAVRVSVTVVADRADPRVRGGELLKRDYEWTISPRNLRYQRNR
ncbi:MAG: prepilin-type N-terminal cleavage/methylation domain-containing protein [Gemmatimonadota bacterium]|nr:MAG: prepilin-type N-terminal cleavage/methylation domain-containing protein [Gemmatimonadota bacterium]